LAFRQYPFAGTIDVGQIGKRSIVFGSAWEKGLAEELKMDFLTITPPSTYRMPLNAGYFGFQGGISFFDDIINTLLPTFA
jgi:hypothetical protein